MKTHTNQTQGLLTRGGSNFITLNTLVGIVKKFVALPQSITDLMHHLVSMTSETQTHHHVT